MGGHCVKKHILMITYDKDASLYHAKQLQSLLGQQVTVSGCSVQELLESSVPDADLYCITTDALEQVPDFQDQLPDGANIVYFFVTFSYAGIQKLREVPADTKALFVNLNEKMALECITSLSQLGINHISFYPFYPGASLAGMEDITLAVTPDERRYIPDDMDQIIDLGQRQVDCNTVAEILLKLKLYDMLESPKILEYFSSIASNFYSYNELLGRSTYMESTFQKLLNVLDIGIIGVDKQENVFIYNRKAEQILGVSLGEVSGKSASEAIPYIPFAEDKAKGYTVGSRLMHFHGTPINVNIVPISRNQKQIGAIAIIRHFAEEEARQNKIRIQLLERGHQAKYVFDDIIGVSPAIQRVKDIAQKMSRTRSSILITGESGTGKELFAHAIHNASERKNRPFIAINCAALPENLLESELFGYVDGAFTGAKKGGKMGLFEFAHTGTFFLDEVEGMSPMLQIKLLRVLQEHEVMRVGDNRMISVDVRVIAATNEKLERLVEAGSFRQDLYYRLNTLPIDLPPLRERKEDIFPLMEAFQKELGCHFTLTRAAQEEFMKHDWNGNIRELRNYVEYFSYLDEPVIDRDALPPGFYRRVHRKADHALTKEDSLQLRELAGKRLDEYRFILQTLEESRQSNQTVGRQYLIEKARDTGLLLSQYEVREILAALEREHCVKISKGRGGTRITERGLALLEDDRTWIQGGCQ